jgi:hypothetical protein
LNISRFKNGSPQLNKATVVNDGILSIIVLYVSKDIVERSKFNFPFPVGHNGHFKLQKFATSITAILGGGTFPVIIKIRAQYVNCRLYLKLFNLQEEKIFIKTLKTSSIKLLIFLKIALVAMIFYN